MPTPFPSTHMIPCISQVTTLPATFVEDAANCPAAGCTAIEVWLTKLEQHLQEVSAPDTQKALADRGVKLVAAAYQGGLLLSQGEQRKVHFDHFKRRLDLCQQFGIPTMLLVADFAQSPDAQSLGRAVVSLAQAAQWAAGFGVKLALEFRGTDAFCSCLDTALTLVEQCAEPNAGVCLDVFHYYKGPSKPEDLDRLTTANLFHVQVCDVAGVPRELMTDSDRVLPGEGDFHLEPIVTKLKQLGYTGGVSLELMNPVLWQMKTTQVIELALAALQQLLK
ncbi:MAG: sugar phosphate isomerase/epimerase [Planctomycetia bacterium]|nr:sugar phosphate isomerase/epimerase [Planctomycetia bacterium]